MLRIHVTSTGKCTYCGSKLRQCVECDEWFLANRKTHIYCRARCRTRRCRVLSKLTQPEDTVMPEQETPVKEEQQTEVPKKDDK